MTALSSTGPIGHPTTMPASVAGVPSAETEAIRSARPSDYLPAEVQVDPLAAKVFGIEGIAMGVLGGAIAGYSLLSGEPTNQVVIGAGAALLGATIFGASRFIGPETREALAAGIPSRSEAELVAGQIPGSTKVVHATDGTWAVLRGDPPRRPSSYVPDVTDTRPSGSSVEPTPAYEPPSDYPSANWGHTSRGDDPLPPQSGGNSTSNGNPSDDDF